MALLFRVFFLFVSVFVVEDICFDQFLRQGNVCSPIVARIRNIETTKSENKTAKYWNKAVKYWNFSFLNDISGPLCHCLVSLFRSLIMFGSREPVV